jgi:hypothetical protein
LPLVSRTLLAVVVSFFAWSARGDDELSLLPLATLHRPIPVDVEPGHEPQLRGCATKAPPPLRDRLPFGPGEVLSYDVAVLGLRTGKVNLRVGERAVMDGVATYPLHAQAKSDGFLEILGNFDARMVSFFDPRALLPVRMVNRTIVKKPFVDARFMSREDGAFAAAMMSAGRPVGGTVHARLRRAGPEGDVDKSAQLKSSADVVDLLSVMYYLRARELSPHAPLCFELYHRRRLWRADGSVVGPEMVSVPSGARRARRVEMMVTGVGAKPPPPRKVTAWISDDADRIPVLITTPDHLGDIEVRLLTHERGRRLLEK